MHCSTVMLKTSTFEENLRAVAGSENLRMATADDAVSGMLPQFVAEPDDEKQFGKRASLRMKPE